MQKWEHTGRGFLLDPCHARLVQTRLIWLDYVRMGKIYFQAHTGMHTNKCNSHTHSHRAHQIPQLYTHYINSTYTGKFTQKCTSTCKCLCVVTHFHTCTYRHTLRIDKGDSCLHSTHQSPSARTIPCVVPIAFHTHADCDCLTNSQAPSTMGNESHCQH